MSEVAKLPVECNVPKPSAAVEMIYPTSVVYTTGLDYEIRQAQSLAAASHTLLIPSQTDRTIINMMAIHIFSDVRAQCLKLTETT